MSITLPSLIEKLAWNTAPEPYVLASAPIAGGEMLVFAVMEGTGAGKVAVEGRYGMVAFAEDMAALKQEIINKVREYFADTYSGDVYIPGN